VTDLATRSALAASLLADDGLSARVCDVLLARHSDEESRYGAGGRHRCIEDGRFHVSFLAGAVQANAPDLYAEHIVWCAEMLESRGIERGHLLEYLLLLEEHLPYRNDDNGVVSRTLAAARLALGRHAPGPVDRPDESTPLRLAYLSAALAGRRGDAWEVTREAKRAGVSLPDIYRHIVLWAQRRLGELWATAKISVAQEHMASAVTQSILSRLYAEIPGERAAGRVLLAGVEGELHVLPAQLAADFLELDGWDVAFAGTHVPDSAVLAAIETERPDVLGLSTTMVFNVPKTVALVLAVRRRFTTLPIVLGGRACNGAVELAKELSVEVGPGGDDAVFRQFARTS
jgi:methanogenic corrinoid protein MtbC1